MQNDLPEFCSYFELRALLLNRWYFNKNIINCIVILELFKGKINRIRLPE